MSPSFFVLGCSFFVGKPMHATRDRFLSRLKELGIEIGGLSPQGPNDATEPSPTPMGLAELSALERRLGVTLPQAYRDFLLQVGGVLFHSTNVSPIEIRAQFGNVEHVCVLFGSEADRGALLENMEDYQGRIPKNPIPIGSDPYGNLHCLGVRGKELGKIYFWDHEGPGKTEQDWKNVTLVASSFEDFIDRLVKADE